MARTAPIRGASSCSTEMATSMHIPFGKSVLHVLQQHIQDGITLVTKLLGTRVRTRIKDRVCLSACPCCCLQCHDRPRSPWKSFMFPSCESDHDVERSPIYVVAGSRWRSFASPHKHFVTIIYYRARYSLLQTDRSFGKEIK